MIKLWHILSKFIKYETNVRNTNTQIKTCRILLQYDYKIINAINSLWLNTLNIKQTGVVDQRNQENHHRGKLTTVTPMTTNGTAIEANL